MDAADVRRLKPMLTQYLKRFDDCFDRSDTRAHLWVYVQGQLSDLSAKSVEPMAVHAGVAPRTLQEFLAQHRWQEDRLRDRLQQLVVAEHAGPHAIGVIDETSDVKKGDKTPGVQRQWCGKVGKQENCLVTVHLGFARDDFHCLLDGELYLPASWAEDRGRCRQAGIPDSMEYRPKWKIALELYDRARANGVQFEYLVADEGYGSKPEFLRELQARGQLFVVEVPRTFFGWLTEPQVTQRPFRKGRGLGRKTPRLTRRSRPAISVESMLKHSPDLRDQAWVPYRVKDGEKGPMVWEVKHVLITMKDPQGLPGLRLHLVVARNALDHNEVKFFLSNAPPETSVQTLLLVAFSRWHVERCFEDQKGEVGLDKFEGRRYLGLKRHLLLTCVSYLFLARVCRQLRGKKTRPDGLPSPRCHRFARACLVVERARLATAHRTRRGGEPANATTQRHGAQVSHQENPSKTTAFGHETLSTHSMQMAVT